MSCGTVRAMEFTLSGQEYGWIDTGIEVAAGQRVEVTASGKISFAKGAFGQPEWWRCPGENTERPARNWDSPQYGKHPAGDETKNSLVFQIGGQTTQVGDGASFDAPAAGRILLTNNDNHCSDNQGSWTVHIILRPVGSDVFVPLHFDNLARAEHGPHAIAKRSGEGLYDWFADVSGQKRPLRLAETYRRLHGSSHIVFATGVHALDWRAADVTRLHREHFVVPVLLVPEDMRGDVAGVRAAISSINTMMTTAQDFFKSQASRTFTPTPPALLFSTLKSAALDAESAKGGDALLHHVEAMLAGTDLRKVLDGVASLIVFAKAKVASPTGVGGRARNNLGIIPPRAIEHPVPNWTVALSSAEDEALYVVLHEGGHGLGLPHTCGDPGASNPGWSTCIADAKNGNSVMRGDTHRLVSKHGARLGPADLVEINKNLRFR
jgi:hypothetical protein